MTDNVKLKKKKNRKNIKLNTRFFFLYRRLGYILYIFWKASRTLLKHKYSTTISDGWSYTMNANYIPL